MNLRKYIGASDFTTFDEDVKQVFHKFMLYYNEEFADVQKAVDDMERNAHISTESVNYRSLHDLLGLQIEFVFDFYFNQHTKNKKNSFREKIPTNFP